MNTQYASIVCQRRSSLEAHCTLVLQTGTEAHPSRNVERWYSSSMGKTPFSDGASPSRPTHRDRNLKLEECGVLGKESSLRVV